MSKCTLETRGRDVAKTLGARLNYWLGRLPKAIQQEISEYFSDREFALASMACLLQVEDSCRAAKHRSCHSHGRVLHVQPSVSNTSLSQSIIVWPIIIQLLPLITYILRLFKV